MTYQKNRALGIPAKAAWNAAKREKDPTIPFEWDNANHYSILYNALWLEEGFNVHARIMLDEDSECDTGKFISEWKPGVIPVKNAQWDSTLHKYFLPEMTEEEHYKEFQKMKIGKTEARELSRKYVIEDYKKAKTYGESWSYVGIKVSIYKSGVKLGESSVWGFEFEGKESLEYLSEETLDIAREALHEAKEKLTELKAA